MRGTTESPTRRGPTRSPQHALRCGRFFRASGIPGLMVVALLLSAIATARTAAAEELLPLHVCFRFEQTAVENLYAEAEVAQIAITESLAKACSESDLVGCWNIVGTAEASPRRLDVWLSSETEWSLCAAVRSKAERGDPAAPDWTVTLYPPGELDRLTISGFPSRNDLPARIDEAFTRMLAAHDAAMLEKLKTIAPLGMLEAEISDDAPDVLVLPLPWERFCRLARSEFIVECRWGNRGIVRLHSIGTGLPLEYAADPPFSAVAVIHHKWEFPLTIEKSIDDAQLTKLPELEPWLLYLRSVSEAPFDCEVPLIAN